MQGDEPVLSAGKVAREDNRGGDPGGEGCRVGQIAARRGQGDLGLMVNGVIVNRMTNNNEEEKIGWHKVS